ncbi:MAG: hypothetical protein AB1403_22520 [Candidatus Riflebacteria bacterium]
MKSKSFVMLSSLFSMFLQCTGAGSEKQPVPEEKPLHDCARFYKIIRDLNAKGQVDQPVWTNYYQDTTDLLSQALAKEYGAGWVCTCLISAGGEHFLGDYVRFENNVDYVLQVYETPEQVEAAVANQLEGRKIIVSRNRVFSYYFFSKGGEKNVSKVIVKAAEDFLKSTE